MNYNVESEIIVLSSVFAQDQNYDKVLNLLEEKDFYDSKNAKIFEILKSFSRIGQKLDHLRLCQIIKEYGLDSKINQEYLDNLLVIFSFAYDLDQQIELLLDLSSKRQIEEMLSIASKSLKDTQNANTDQVIDMFKRGFESISIRGNNDDNVNLTQVIEEVEIELQELAKSDNSTTGVQTHLKQLDEKTAGLQAGDLIILAARPSMGKTAMSLTLINNMINDNKKAMIFSLEMSAGSLIKRLLSMESLVSLEKIRTGDFNNNEMISIKEATTKMKTWDHNKNLVINDRPGISIEEIHQYSKKVHQESGLDIIFVDYLQLATTKSKSESRINEVSEISRKLKEIARDLKVPVIALSQLSRAVEQRTNKRPMLSDLRESGAIEQDADVILFLYRDQYYNKASDDTTTEIIIGKQRNGPTDTVRASFQQERTMFVDFIDAGVTPYGV